MLFKVTTECMIKSHDDHRNHHNCQNYVRDKDGQIKSLDPTQVRKFCGPMMVMINNISTEENRGKDEGGDHRNLVFLFTFRRFFMK